jgi:hypothetical protein
MLEIYNQDYSAHAMALKYLTSLPSLYTTILHSKYTDRLKELVTDGQG